MQAGKLRHRLVFQSLGTTQDTFGEESNTATIVATLWGRVSPLIGDELFTAQQVVPEITHEVTIRYNSIITPKMQFVFSGRTFNVLSIKAIDEIHHEMILKVKEQI